MMKFAAAKTLRVLVSLVTMIAFIPGCTDVNRKVISEQHQYDKDGRLVAQTAPDGGKTSYKYDSRGQLVEIAYPSGKVSYGYDANGNRAWMSDATGLTQYYYDAFDRPVAVASRHSPWRFTLHDYDDQGNLTHVWIYNPDLMKQEAHYQQWLNELMKASDGNRQQQEQAYQQMAAQLRTESPELLRQWCIYDVGYQYDAASHLSAIQTAAGTITYSQSPDQGQVVRQLPNGIKSTFSYTPEGWLQSIRHDGTAGPIAEYRYEHNPAGNVTAAHELTPMGSATTTFDWDARGYLSRLTMPDGLFQQFEYDAMGNRTRMQDATGWHDYKLDDYGRLAQAGGTNYTWGGTGNLASETRGQDRFQFSYDGRGLLAGAKGPGFEAAYDWDGDGNLVRHQVGNDQTFIVPDPIAPSGMPLAEFDKAGALTAGYVYGDGLLGKIDATGQPRFFLEDGFNSVRMATDRNGSILGSVDYTPFAQPINLRGDLGCSFRTAGNRLLPELGTYAMGGRLYDPATARFNSPDPAAGFLERFDSQNRYAHSCNATVLFNQPRCNQTHGRGRVEEDLGQAPFHVWDLPNPHVSLTPSTVIPFPSYPGENIPISYEFARPEDAEEYGEQPLGFMHEQPDLPENGVGTSRAAAVLGVVGLFMDALRGVAQFRNDPKANLHTALQDYANDVAQRLSQEGRQSFAVVPVSATWNPDDPLKRVTVTPYSEEDLMNRGSQAPLVYLYVGYRSPEDAKKAPRNLEFRADPLAPSRDKLDDTRRLFKGPDWPDDHGGGGGRGGGFAGPLGSNRFLSSPMGPIESQLGGIELAAKGEFAGDLGRVTGAVYDSASKKFVLLGDRRIAGPSLKPADLAVALALAYSDPPMDPQFTLDPADPTNPRGDWLKAVYIPEGLSSTSFGKAMYEADWLLKEYSFGVHVEEGGRVVMRRSNVPGVKSMADLAFEKAASGREETWARFWIVSEEMKLRQTGNAIYFDVAKMGVKAKKIVPDPSNPQGFHDVDADDPQANEFARLFTEHYDELAREAPELERVRELAKAVALAKWMKEKGVPVDLDWVRSYANQQVPTVDRVTALNIPHERTSERRYARGDDSMIETQIWTLKLFGGVDLQVTPSFTSGGKETGELQEDVTTELARKETGPVFTIEQEGTLLQATVLPLTSSGQALWEKAPALEVDGVVYQLNEQRKVTKGIAGDGSATEYAYDPAGKLATVKMAGKDGWQVEGQRDGAGSEWSVKSPCGNSFRYDYGNSGYLTRVDVDGRTWASYEVDEAGREVVAKYDRHTERSTYDAGGNLRRYELAVPSDGQGALPQPVLVECNEHGNPTKVTGPGLAAIDVAYTTDGTKPARIVTPRAQVECSYDPEGRIAGLKASNGNSVAYEYDGNQLKRLMVGAGTSRAEYEFGEFGPVRSQDLLGCVADYGYTDGRLSSVKIAGSGQAEYAYDENGGMKEMKLPDGSRTTIKRSAGKAGTTVTVETYPREASAAAQARRTRPTDRAKAWWFLKPEGLLATR